MNFKFKAYGILGIILIFLVELNFFFKIQPFADWYFPIIWLGYILVIDAIVYKLKGKSFINNYPLHFIGLFVLSSLFWYVFEFQNIFVQNWKYIGVDSFSGGLLIFANLLAFSTVLPAFFETTELIRAIHLFDKIKLKKSYKISKALLYSLIVLGIISFFIPMFLPLYTFPLIWLSFFLILDPINYLNKQPSIIGHLKDRKLVVPLSLLLAGIIMGFFWEFWNFWAIPKWIYNIPFVGFFKIFEMPILGFLGYFPFAFELYAMYWFVRSLFIHKEVLLVK
jgi:hypothetical protein